MFRRTQFSIALVVTMTMRMGTPIVAQTNNAKIDAQPAPAAGAAESTAITVAARADALQDSANKLHEQPARYSDAARLYRESATLRSWSDTRAVEALAKAGHLYGYANRLTDARRTMEQAAQRALAGGDIVRAAQATMDAAFFAAKQGNRVQANRLGKAALRLAESPLITAEQRAWIVGRIKEVPATGAPTAEKSKVTAATTN